VYKCAGRCVNVCVYCVCHVCVTVYVMCVCVSVPTVRMVSDCFTKHAVTGLRKCKLRRANGALCTTEYNKNTGYSTLTYHIETQHKAEHKQIQNHKRKGVQ
jgi:hypothetical protein